MGGIDKGDRATLSGEGGGRTKSEVARKPWGHSLKEAVMRSCVMCFDGSRKTKEVNQSKGDLLILDKSLSRVFVRA